MTNESNYIPLPEAIPITEQHWPEETVPLVYTRTMTYNHEAYIRECIDGILMQKTTFPVQVLIHDDASTDGTAEIVREYAEKYPNVIRAYFQKENTYRHPNRRELRAEFASWRIGKYSAICEGDDYWTDTCKLQKQVDLLESKPHCSVCAHNVYFISDHGKRLAWESPRKAEYTLDDQLRRHFVATCSLMFRETCCPGGNSPYWMRLAPGGDVTAVAMCLQHGNLACINDVMACYREHPGGVFSSRSKAERFLFALGNRSALVDNLFGYRPSLIEGMYFYLKTCILSAVRDDELHVAREAIRKYMKYVWRQQPGILPVAMLAYFPRGVLPLLLKFRRKLKKW